MDPFGKLKLKLNIPVSDTTQDALLSVYLEDAHDYVISETKLDEVPPILMSTVVDLAVMNFSRRDDMGVKTFTEGGISVTYNDPDGIPQSIRKQILKFRRL